MKTCVHCNTEQPDAWCEFIPLIGWVCFDCQASLQIEAEKTLNNLNCFYCGRKTKPENVADIIPEGIVCNNCKNLN